MTGVNVVAAILVIARLRAAETRRRTEEAM
jgi:hypothetical protein